jgi:DNA-binding CsgD family transcriptional regulator
MATETARRQARGTLERLARADMDTDGFRCEAAKVLREAVGFDWWCWDLLDPGVDLPTRYLATNPIVPGAQRRFWQLMEPGFGSGANRNAQTDVTVLSAATEGDLESDPLWRELLGPAGAGDDLRAPLVADGVCWAFLDLGRERSSGWFSLEDAAFVAELGPLLASRLRDGLRASSRPDEEPDEAGTIILDRELGIAGSTETAWRWIDRLGLEQPSEAEPLPAFMYALATRAVASSPDRPSTVRVRLHTSDGRWVVARATPLTDGGPMAGGLVLTLEPARSDDLAPLLMRAWSLSNRERDVARLVIDGMSNEDVAATLYISPHTVRDHLKSIFDRMGVRRRSDLAAALAGHATETHDRD